MSERSETNVKIGRLVSSRGVGEWCHPGDDQKQRWILVFDDYDVPVGVYYDQQEAYTAFERAEGIGWNCHLFSSVPRSDC